ncbi:MAG: isopenicillin N synthase family oxygenase, partial [Alphaproteobacteria bacterium]|nr:isopenicillin N synthase family oxygenase [Alphaproteobacteria bacterium]
MAYAQAKQFDASLIPVIDITPLRDGTDPIGVARALHAASQDLGFIYIQGHGIPLDTIDAARNSAMDFFRAPEADKASIAVSTKHRGWLGQNGAKMQDDAKPDLKESFIWGCQDNDGKAPDDHHLRGDNKWPAFAPDMQTLAMNYFDGVHEVAHHLMRGFALGLDLEEDFFLRTASQPLSRASYVYYPQQPEDMGDEQFGVGPHTDFGVLTVLCQDSVGG